MTQIGESIAVTMISEEKVDETHYTSLEVCYPNGEPYQDYVSIRPVIDGNEGMGALNFEGMYWDTMLESGTSVTYEVGDDVDNELAEVRAQIKETLDAIIEQETNQQRRDNALLAQENVVMQSLILTGAFMTGVGEGAVGMFEFAGDVVELGGKAVWMNVQAQANMLEAAWEKYAEGDEKGYFESLNEKNVEDFANIFGITPKEIVQKMLQAYEVLAFVIDDSDTQDMLFEFAKSYALSQSKVEVATMVGAAAFDIILAAVLAVTTGGAGNAAQVLAKVRHAGKFTALAKRLKLFVKLSKQKKLRTSIKGKKNGTVKVEVKAPASAKIEPRKVKDKDFDQRTKDTTKDKDSDSSKDKDKDNSPEADSSPDSSKDAATTESGKNKNGDTCSADSKTCTGGEPISLVTGEEILPLTDFTLDGPLPLTWERKYKSSNRDNIGLGHGWTHPFAYKLLVQSDKLELHDAEARVIPFGIPAIGRSSHNLAEKLSLKRLTQTGYILTDSSSNIERHFDSVDGAGTLNLSQIRDNIGNLYYLYYQNSRLDRIQAGHGDTWDFNYEKGNISTVTWCLASGKRKLQAQYQYDANDDLVAAADAGGNKELYAYSNHLITKRTLKSGYSFHFKWSSTESNARCIRNWGDAINDKPTYDYTFKWDQKNRSVEVTDTRGGVTTHQFNDRGLPIYICDPEGGQTYYHYDSLGNLTREVDAQGNGQNFEFNSRQQLKSYTNKQGQKRHFEWDKSGNQTQVLDPLGQSWNSEFNKRQQLVKRTNPLGESYLYEYNELGLTSRVTDPEGKSWHYLWDHQARLTAIRNPLGQNTRYSYDAEGQMIRTTWPDGQSTQYRYDSNGNCIAIKAADGKVQNYAYSSLGLLNQHVDGNGRKTVYEYNGLSQVVRRTDPTGQTLDYHYDGERNLVGLTNEKGEHYHLQYDLNERLIQEVGFDGRVQRYVYNDLGHLVSSRDYSADGKELLNEIVYQRDVQGRLLRQNDGKTGKRLNEFKYDPLGRLEQARNGHSNLQWKYDPVGRVIEDHQGEQVLKHSYSPSGQRTASLLPNGDKLQYSFDDAGAFESLNYNGDTVADITRDQMGREVQRQLGNKLVTENNYDPQGRLLRQSTSRQQSDVQAPSLTERKYHYNSDGQLSQIDDKQRGTTRYHYDKLDRLTQVQGPVPESFVHDPAGNILSITEDGGGNGKAASAQVSQQSASQVQGNRLAFQGDTHYKYDALGNRVAQGRGKNQSIRSFFRYNALNQLTDVKTDKQHTQYAYDPLGRRIVKAVGKDRTDFLWMDDVLLSETALSQEQAEEGSPPTEKLYLFEPGTFKPLAMVQNKSVYHYHLDHLGTPQEITDSTGKVVWAVSYKAYGSLALAYESEIENNIRFQGQYFDEESGLHYNRFRYYDPSAGQFISQDPIGLLGGVNNYQYAPNPVSWIDPYGLTCKEGYAVVRQYENGHPEGHFTVEVVDDDLSYRTHQVITTEDHSQTTIRRSGQYEAGKAPVHEAVVPLPDANAALQLQKSQVNSDLGKYDPIENSCLSHVCDVLEVGGAPEVKRTDKGYMRFTRKNGFRLIR